MSRPINDLVSRLEQIDEALAYPQIGKAKSIKEKLDHEEKWRVVGTQVLAGERLIARGKTPKQAQQIADEHNDLLWAATRITKLEAALSNIISAWYMKESEIRPHPLPAAINEGAMALRLEEPKDYDQWRWKKLFLRNPLRRGGR